MNLLSCHFSGSYPVARRLVSPGGTIVGTLAALLVLLGYSTSAYADQPAEGADDVR